MLTPTFATVLSAALFVACCARSQHHHHHHHHHDGALQRVLNCRREVADICHDAHNLHDRFVCVADHQQCLSDDCDGIIHKVIPCMDDITGKGICAPTSQNHTGTDILQCLLTHQKEVSPACNQYVHSLPSVKCKPILDESCPGAKTLGEEILCVTMAHREEAIVCGRSIGELTIGIALTHLLLGGHMHRSEIREACQQDIAELCPSNELGFELCLANSRSRLTQKCLETASQGALFQCAPSIARLCNVKPLGEQTVECLNDNVDEVEAQCVAQMKQDETTGYSPIYMELAHADNLYQHLDENDDDEEEEWGFRSIPDVPLMVGGAAMFCIVAAVVVRRHRAGLEPQQPIQYQAIAI